MAVGPAFAATLDIPDQPLRTCCSRGANYPRNTIQSWAKGIHIVMATDWHAPAPESWEYNLATYFLLNGVQGDYFVGDAPNELPPTLWPGYAIKLGELDRRARTPKRRHLAAQICWRRGLRR